MDRSLLTHLQLHHPSTLNDSNTRTDNSPSQAMASTGIEELPPELHVDIAERLNPQDLLNLRKVNKLLCSAVHDRFLDAFFQRKAFTFTVFGLKTLVKITSRADLCKRLKEICFVTVKPWSVDYICRLSTIRQWEREEKSLYEKGIAFEYVFNSLRNLKHSTVFSHVSFETFRRSYNHRAPKTKPIGVAHLMESLGLDGPDRLSAADRNPAVHALLSAATLAGCRIKYLSLEEDLQNDDSPAVTSMAWRLGQTITTKLPNAWSHLVSLDLAVTQDHNTHLWYMKKACSLRPFLSAASNLRRVRLVQNTNFREPGGHRSDPGLYQHCYWDGSLASFAEILRSNQLRELRLEGFRTVTGDVVKILEKHNKSLLTLRLLNCDIPASSSWIPVLRYMAEKLRLKRFCLNDLQRDQNYLLFTYAEVKCLISPGAAGEVASPEAVKKLLAETMEVGGLRYDY